MNIFVINCGSSSFKYQLIDMTTEKPLCSGLVERIGGDVGRLTHKVKPDTDEEKKYVFDEPFVDHTSGMKAVFDLLTDKDKGVITSLEQIKAIGHRIVQGGELLRESCKIGKKEKEDIAKLTPLAPLHNPANLQGIEVAEKLLPHAPGVGVFDTEFHATMPPEAYLYSVPYSLYEELKVRRYGFHGTSHAYVSEVAAKLINKPLDSCNFISCHLGNGCSLAAIKNGKSIDTSMGMTPLAGLMMGTRSGDIDPAIHTYLGSQKNMSLNDIDAMLNKESGLFGICGTNDMRDIHAAREAGDKRAILAFDMFVYRIRHFLGAYYVLLGNVDGIIFTAGIGENDEIMRSAVCANLENLGIAIDEEVNKVRSGTPRFICKKGSKMPVMVIPTNEELAIAKATKRVLGL